MAEINVTIKRSTFPLMKFFFTIGNENFFIRPGEIKKINLPMEGEHEITVSSFWISYKNKVALRNDATLSINHVVPDLYYLIGISLITLLSILTFFSLFNTIWFSGIILAYIFPIFLFSTIKTKNYFKIKIKDHDG